jgi:hypothetical protein
MQRSSYASFEQAFRDETSEASHDHMILSVTRRPTDPAKAATASASNGLRRLRARLDKKIVDDQAAMPSS